MSGKELFIKSVEECIENYPEKFNDEALKYFEEFKQVTEEKKELFTENGKAILKYLQSVDKEMHKAKDIADAMEISSKTVSGAMRKLVTDGYVEKTGKNPVIYNITLKGKEVIFEEEN